MPFATDQERLELREADSTFGLDFVVRFSTSRGDSELTAESIDHALEIQHEWIKRGAHYVEIFRVLHDGSLNPTIGPYDPDQMRDSRD